MSRLRKWLSLLGSERRLLLRAWLLLVLLRLGLWLLPFRTVQSLVSSNRFAAPVKHSTLPVARIGWAVQVASVYVPFATCLAQALAAQVLLRRQGYVATVRIGVAQAQAGRIKAHAWVECAGEIVIGGSADSLVQYTPLPVFPPERHSLER